jgi:site-specific recombinase XerD
VKALLTLLLDTGLRIDEALSLETRNINWDSLVLTVVGKGNRERVIPFSPQCRKALWRLHEATKDGTTSKLLFRTRSGLKVSYRNAFRDIKTFCSGCKVEGPHVHPHAFRHYFAVSFLRAGGDIYRLSRILGHSNITTTTIYLRSINVDQLRESHAVCSPLARLG